MKNIFSKFAASIVILAASLTSCDKADDFNYEGEDNYITKLAITANDVTYNASIQDDQITITIPENVSLAEAVVEYAISENATISPDPAYKSDWSAEQQFVVTSYSDVRRAYVYRVERKGVEASGNITLNSQADVDAFAAEGNSAIDGNLIIGKSLSADDPISSLATLSSIKTISHNLIIGEGLTAESLEGFESLESVGSISIDDNETLKTIYLPALTSVGTSLTLLADNLESITCDMLTFIGDEFTVKSNALIASSFNKLSFVGGTMTFNGGSASTAKSTLERIQFPALAEVDGALYMGYWSKAYLFEMPQLKTVGGAVTFKSWSAIETIELPSLISAEALSFETITSSLAASLPELGTLAGKFTINATGITSLSAPKLASVAGQLYIYAGCSKLTTIDFSQLAHIHELEVRSTAMTNLKDYFPALTTVDEKLSLYACASFTGDVDLTGISAGNLYIYGSTLDNVTSITGDDDFDGQLSIYNLTANLAQMPTFKGFKNIKSLYVSTSTAYKGAIELDIETVTESATFQSCTNATGISLPALTKAGSFKFLYCNQAQSVSFPALTSITGYGEGDDAVSGNFNYTVSSALNTIDLTSLESVDGDFLISSIDAKAEIDKITFSKIATIGGELMLEGTSNAHLNDLSTFATLTSVGKVTIKSLTSLADFTGLKGAISTLAAGNWSVTGCAYNPTYDNMVAGEYAATVVD